MDSLPLICTLVGVAGVVFSIVVAARVKAARAKGRGEDVRIYLGHTVQLTQLLRAGVTARTRPAAEKRCRPVLEEPERFRGPYILA